MTDAVEKYPTIKCEIEFYNYRIREARFLAQNFNLALELESFLLCHP
jgi:hypothetical protein